MTFCHIDSHIGVFSHSVFYTGPINSLQWIQCPSTIQNKTVPSYFRDWRSSWTDPKVKGEGGGGGGVSVRHRRWKLSDMSGIFLKWCQGISCTLVTFRICMEPGTLFDGSLDMPLISNNTAPCHSLRFLLQSTCPDRQYEIDVRSAISQLWKYAFTVTSAAGFCVRFISFEVNFIG